MLICLKQTNKQSMAHTYISAYGGLKQEGVPLVLHEKEKKKKKVKNKC